MFNAKFFTILLTICLSVFMLKNKINSNSISEAFGMNPSMTTKMDVVTADSPESAQKGDFYSVPGTYQALLSPRFSGTANYGANIRYNLPSYENLAVPYSPLTFGQMASEGYSKENYGQGGSPSSCSKGGESLNHRGGAPETKSNYSGGNYGDVMNDVYSNSQYPEITSSLPVGDMTTVNSAGETIHPIVYDRYIYANRHSRLRRCGDPFRGDLAIMPHSTGWFRPSVQPNIDLQSGALAVMGGSNNETANELAKLMYNSSGNSAHGIAGIPGNQAVSDAYSLNMSNQTYSTTGAGGNDIQISAYP